MPAHPLLDVIRAADRAISANDHDALMEFYADDAVLVVRPGCNAVGKDAIRRAFTAIAEYFHHDLTVGQGEAFVLESGDTALVIMETRLEYPAADGRRETATRRATYVFRRSAAGRWLCTIDNSYGTDLLANGPAT